MSARIKVMRLAGAALVTLAVAPWLGMSPATAGAPAGHQGDCPAGTTQVAKFNVGGNTYTAEGNANGVVITSGSSTGGTFTSVIAISDVFVKAGTDDKINHYDPAVKSGSFDNTTLVNNGGQVPAISHVTFCAPEGGSTSSPPISSPPASSSSPATKTTTATKTVTTTVPTTNTATVTTTVPTTATATVTTTVPTTSTATVTNTVTETLPGS